MKPVTQMLRAFIETDPPKTKGSGRRRQSQRQAQIMEMADIERKLEALFAAPLEAPSAERQATNTGADKVPLPEPLSAAWVTELCRALYVLFAVFVLSAVLHAFPREAEAAGRAAIRRASPDTAWSVFADALRERIEERLRRAEAERLRKRRARRAKDKVNHPSGDVVQKRTRRRTFGDDDTQKVASEPDTPARVANADKVAAAELMAADEGENVSLD